MLIALETNQNKEYYGLMKSIVPEISQQPHGKPVTTRHLPNLEFIVLDTEENLPWALLIKSLGPFKWRVFFFFVLSLFFCSRGVIKYWDVCQSRSKKSISYLKKINLELSPHAICNIQFTSVRCWISYIHV